MMAALKRNPAAVKVLLEHNANLHAEDKVEAGSLFWFRISHDLYIAGVHVKCSWHALTNIIEPYAG